jgi:hypothetical protein
MSKNPNVYNYCKFRQQTQMPKCLNVEQLNVTMHLSKSKVDKIRQLTDAKLAELYPAAVGQQLCVFLQPPSLGASGLADDAAKFAANLSCVTDIEVRLGLIGWFTRLLVI